MRKIKRYRNISQSLTEYAVLLAIVASALIAMQVYIKRGIQGRIRDMADEISSSHYESFLTTSEFTTQEKGITVSSYDSGITKIEIPKNPEDDLGAERTYKWGSQITQPDAREAKIE